VNPQSIFFFSGGGGDIWEKSKSQKKGGGGRGTALWRGAIFCKEHIQRLGIRGGIRNLIPRYSLRASSSPIFLMDFVTAIFWGGGCFLIFRVGSNF